MSAARLEWKVGLFVFVCLVLLGTMMLRFSKGVSLWGGHYNLFLTTQDIGGVRQNAAVQMAGVKVGQVTAIDYDSDKLEVVLKLTIQERYRIPSNSLFTIETAGFLGEQYVAISPQARSSDFLAPNAQVTSREPFNLQEAARSAMHLIQNVDGTISNLNAALLRVDRTLLAEETLTNITAAVANFRSLSEETTATVQQFRLLSQRAHDTVDGLDLLVETNSPAVTGSLSNLYTFTSQLQSITNLIAFSETLNQLGNEVRDTLASNRPALTVTLQNFESASGSLRELLGGLQAGQGLAGSLLKDPQIDLQTAQVLSNLTTLSSNLTRFGLLYKPKPPKTPNTNAPVKSPFANRWPF